MTKRASGGDHFDAIVIGSGAGGLSAAITMAHGGLRTLVLEAHSLPGGWCHTFALEGFRFSPGVHYLGELGEGGALRGMFAELGLGEALSFREMNPDGYDHLAIGGERFDIPAGGERFRDRLHARFPRERRGIDRYLRRVDRVFRDLRRSRPGTGAKALLSTAVRAPNLALHGLRPTAGLIRRHARDPLLQAILGIRAGNHGVAPSRVPFAQHVAIEGHYREGAWYPRGGGSAIPKAMIRRLRELGGEIRLRAEVDEILVDGTGRHARAEGVRLVDGEELRAPILVSNADAHRTYLSLVGREHLPARLLRKLHRTPHSVSAVSLFLGIDMDLAAAGFDSGNWWIQRGPDVEETYRYAARADLPGAGDPPGVFLSFPTLKDPSIRRDGLHTAEAFAFVSREAFRPFDHTEHARRGIAYEEFKADLSERIMRRIETVAPGIGSRVVFSALGTPLTNEHFLLGTNGSLYGPEKTAQWIGPFAYPMETPVGGLFHCGASTLGHGVMGVVGSGMLAGGRALARAGRALSVT
ncbi:MAG: NAD(P)/FAD-dependent oxidoreductase [Gemmatimonadota bacterium]|nr:NAD(P)/FAD-dependent oxidoreductase [Gemmatimonadota bacterium]MDP6803113.1 NAD(P)/FAD-dependent oxidoreductase [Gemmatimonadota bacterium]MDP7031892.1 NAD(P)/FAD-dependent oxidoreductase [Gemmatimonadota bacterium]